MCGIAGIIGNGTEDQLQAMLKSQSHRGPDAECTYNDDNDAFLGHNRLAIIDLTDGANQPFLDNTGQFIIVFNGEIYNYLELKEELKAHYEFKTKSDTEVLLASYIVHGKDCLHKLNGMFAFAIWDKKNKSLFAARDRFGVKPFYYKTHKDTFFFSSEIKALHKAGIDKKVNEKVWATYFVYGSYGNLEETFWDDILQLPAGHFAVYEDRKLTIKKWYFFEEEVKKKIKTIAFDEAKDKYFSLLENSIALRFRSDVPVGFTCSGGLDSSVLVALINKNQKEKIKAYTFYTNDENYDELPWTAKLMDQSKNELTKVLLESGEVPDFVSRMTEHQDEPFGGIPTLAYAKIFEKARKDNVLVVLDGQGMDEQWAGYDYYWKGNEATIQGLESNPFKENIHSKYFLEKAEKPVYPKPFEEELLNMQYRDLFYTKIPRALRFNDRLSMMNSIELREPFLDYRLVELAFSLPVIFKKKGETSKYMLRKIASEHLIEDVAFAPKRPLQTPQREWLQKDLKEWVINSFKTIQSSEFAHFFDKNELENELKMYLEGNAQSSFHIWQCISFSEMLKTMN